jgi:cysteine synthase
LKEAEQKMIDKDSYEAVMARQNEIIWESSRLDYQDFRCGRIAFDYERMMKETGYTLEEITTIQRETGVGNTPLVELKNITKLIRSISGKGKGARIFVKDEANNPSRSFKDRRASVSVYHATVLEYEGVAAATSGNYGAAVASQAAKRGLDCIIVQESFDSRGIEQPEITEKSRACEAYGAEVLRVSVGPELFYLFLRVLEDTHFFNASLYVPYGVAGVETLGFEIAEQTVQLAGKFPDAVVITHAGGGNLTGTARGLLAAGATETQVIAASVNLAGLHMASDKHFNLKSFTTGHTGFGIPFTVLPDRVDVPISAARPLRYVDRYVTVNQGSVFYATAALAELEGMERGPAGNTSLGAALGLAQEMDEDQVIVVNETEYTGAGKHFTAQLSQAKKMGIEVMRGNPTDEKPGENIIIPERIEQVVTDDVDLIHLRKSYIRNAIRRLKNEEELLPRDLDFLAEETKSSRNFVLDCLKELAVPFCREGIS